MAGVVDVLWGESCRMESKVFVDSVACVKIDGVESGWFKMESGVRQECVMPSWLFNWDLNEWQ